MYRPAFFDDNFFNDFLGFPEKNHTARREPDLIRADVLESADGYQLELELAGYTKDEISIKLEDGYLSIAASKKAEPVEDTRYKYVRRERHMGNCARRFYIGKTLTQEDIKARFENGILILSFPKEDTRKAEAARYINID